MDLFPYDPLLVQNGRVPMPGATVKFYALADTNRLVPLEVFTMTGVSLGKEPRADSLGYINNAAGYQLPVPAAVSQSGAYPPRPVYSIPSIIDDASATATAAAASAGEAMEARRAAESAQAAADEAAARALAPTQEAVATALTVPGPAKTAVDASIQAGTARLGEQLAAVPAQISDAVAPVSTTIQTAADPLAYINSVEVLCAWDTRPAGGESTFPQGVEVNPDAGEIYVANQGGTVLRIDIRSMDGTKKSSKVISTDDGAYTEGLPYWYNTRGQLCFMVRTGTGATEATYNVYNYSTGVLGPQIPIQGIWKAHAQGNLLITTDSRTNDVSKFFVYDFASVQSESPILLNTIYAQSAGPTMEKNQGIVLNGGYIFMIQGAGGSSPVITTYNLAGHLVNAHRYGKVDFAAALNDAKPGLITSPSYDYESEGGCTMGGSLVTMHVINNTSDIKTSKTILLRHNSIGGVKLAAAAVPYVHDTGWVDLKLLGSAVRYGSDTTPRIRRVGNQVYLEGAVKGLTAGNVDVAEIPADFRPRFNRQYTQIFGASGQSSSWQITVNPGTVKLLGVTAGTINETAWLPLSTSWLRG